MRKRYRGKPFGDRPFGTVPCSRRKDQTEPGRSVQPPIPESWPADELLVPETGLRCCVFLLKQKTIETARLADVLELFLN